MPPPPPRRAPSQVTRRKLLVTAAFGAANAVVLSRFQRPGSQQGQGGAGGSGGTGSGAAATEPVVMEGATPQDPTGHSFAMVLLGGRVIDPGSGFDGVANVGIDGSTITAISTEPLAGQVAVDASGLVVSPGFIDLLSFEPNPVGDWYKIADGVTTALGMHGLNYQAAAFFEQMAGKVPYHYGGAWDDAHERGFAREIDIGEAPSGSQLASMVAGLTEGLAAGFIGLSFEPEYTPGVTNQELVSLARVAAAHGVPVFFHVRYSDPDPPGTNAEAIAEVLDVARQTGASVHVDHITSTGGTFTMAETLATLEAARADGIDVTACMYPYDSWATYPNSARFNDGWQDRFRISYSDLQVAGTSDRLTESGFEAAQEANLLVAAYAIPEEDLELALAAPWVMVASDGLIEEAGNNHPRGAGCFSRTLGRYVREKELIPLVDALAKMTILPAQRLERGAPALRRKGRLQVGADADICVFDPDRIIDRATVANPEQYSEGIEWVLVAGQVAMDPSGLKRDVFAGTPIQSEPVA